MNLQQGQPVDGVTVPQMYGIRRTYNETGMKLKLVNYFIKVKLECDVDKWFTFIGKVKGINFKLFKQQT